MTSSITRALRAVAPTAAAVAGATILLLSMLLLNLSLVRGASVDPIFVPGADNKTCQELADIYALGSTWIELKADPNPIGPGPFPYTDGTLTVNITNGTADDKEFDWSSNIGVDAVFVKAGTGGSNLYLYDEAGAPNTEATSDTDLRSPGDTGNGISHIAFCYDLELEVTKTAETSLTRTHQWTIDKSVDRDAWSLFRGDDATSTFEIEVDKTGSVDSLWTVEGTIEVYNPHPTDDAIIDAVTDSISGIGSVAVTCEDGDSNAVSFPNYVLGPQETIYCEYGPVLTGNGDARTNTATAVVDPASDVPGGSDSVNFDFDPADNITEINSSINVTDDNATAVNDDDHSFGPFTDDATTGYSTQYTCDADEGSHTNTAEIVETSQTATETVTVTCYALDATKDADPAFKRTWTWLIDKSADQTNLMLSPGQLFAVNYEVEVSATSDDTDHAVSGTITIDNDTPLNAELVGVSDSIAGFGAATITGCTVDGLAITTPSVGNPYMLLAGDTMLCDYAADLPDNATRENTGTATLQNYSYTVDETDQTVATASGTTNFTGTASIDFSTATMSEIDECVDVTDTNAVTDLNPTGLLGEVCADDVDKTFNYSLWFGQHAEADVQLECGDNTHVNRATFVTNDTSTTNYSEWTVTAHVACEVGCTLTPGYWKTHSSYGPAPYDDTWAQIGEDTDFFLSEVSYYEALWTPPRGNAYWILAHAYIAVELNFLNGASSTASVDAAFAAATTFFESLEPGDKLSKSERQMVLGWATTLDNYNNGLIGPGHCSE